MKNKNKNNSNNTLLLLSYSTLKKILPNNVYYNNEIYIKTDSNFNIYSLIMFYNFISNNSKGEPFDATINYYGMTIHSISESQYILLNDKIDSVKRIAKTTLNILDLNNFKNGNYVRCLNQDIYVELPVLKYYKHKLNLNKNITFLVGWGGSGKTYNLKKYIYENSENNYIYINPEIDNNSNYQHSFITCKGEKIPLNVNYNKLPLLYQHYKDSELSESNYNKVLSCLEAVKEQISSQRTNVIIIEDIRISEAVKVILDFINNENKNTFNNIKTIISFTDMESFNNLISDLNLNYNDYSSYYSIYPYQCRNSRNAYINNYKLLIPMIKEDIPIKL